MNDAVTGNLEHWSKCSSQEVRERWSMNESEMKYEKATCWGPRLYKA